MSDIVIFQLQEQFDEMITKLDDLATALNGLEVDMDLSTTNTELAAIKGHVDGLESLFDDVKTNTQASNLSTKLTSINDVLDDLLSSLSGTPYTVDLNFKTTYDLGDAIFVYVDEKYKFNCAGIYIDLKPDVTFTTNVTTYHFGNSVRHVSQNVELTTSNYSRFVLLPCFWRQENYVRIDLADVNTDSPTFSDDDHCEVTVWLEYIPDLSVVSDIFGIITSTVRTITWGA